MFARTKRAGAGLLVGALALLGLAVAPAAVAAPAPTFATTATITDLVFEDKAIFDQTDTRLQGSWSLPNTPTTPAGFTIEFPEELHGKPDQFPLLTPDSQERMGYCVANQTSLTCTIDESYIKDNPLQLKGTFNFWAKSVLKNSEEVDHEFDFKNINTKTTVKVKPASRCTENCEFKGMEGRKYGYYHNDDNTITWVIEVPAPAEGLNEGDAIEVKDTLGTLQQLRSEKPLRVQEATEIVTDGQGRNNPVWKDMDPSRYTSSTDPIQLNWTAAAHSYYRVFVDVEVSDGGAAKTYENAADITLNKSVVKQVTGKVTRYGGSGTGLGTNEGRFTIIKKVEGDAVIDPARTFTVNFAVTAADGSVIDSGEAEVSTLEPFVSKTYPRGASVSLEEAALKNEGAVRWEKPVLSQNNFELQGGQETSITLTNTATLVTGTFSAQKEVVGSGADALPADATFELDYSYPAGEGFAAGEGTLTLPADGTEVTSPELPVGAEVSLSERDPAPVKGSKWTGSELSTDLVIISEDSQSVDVVTVTNTLVTPPTVTTVPPAPPVPPTKTTTTPPAPPTTVVTTPPTTITTAPPLPETGSQLGALPWAAGAVLLLGAGLLVASRRRAKH